MTVPIHAIKLWSSLLLVKNDTLIHLEVHDLGQLQLDLVKELSNEL
jgi:hypothetical protein